MKRLLALAAILILLLVGLVLISDKFSVKFTPKFDKAQIGNLKLNDNGKVRVVTEESVVTDTVDKVGPSVVTVTEVVPPQAAAPDNSNNPFYQMFGIVPPQGAQQPQDNQPQSIGSGFVVSNDGLIVTNKHVVSDAGGKYQVITNKDKKYDVVKIYRDPLNDVAILKINSNDLKPVEMGDSDNLRVGQFVIAIGSALGEFRNSVTTGVISGLGRGITAGSQYEGFAEKLDNVIQTDAAINPGNSGGPLLNSSSQVIGVNTAVSAEGQNIGFALPINVIKQSLDNFNKTGQFNRPFIGVSYVVLTPDIAAVNEMPAGAYVENVIANSPAEKAGIQKGDIIVSANGKQIQKDKFELSQAISENKVGDSITLKVWNDGKTRDVKVTLGTAPEQ